MKSFQDILIQQLSTEYVVEKEGEGLWDKCKSLFKIGEKTDDKSQKETKENAMFSFAKMFSHIGLFPQESKYSQERKKMREDNAAKRKELLKSKKDALEDLRIAKMKADNNKTQFLASAKINAEINRIKTALKDPSKAKSSFIKDIVEHPERNQDFIKTYIDQKYPEVDEPQKPSDDASDEEKRKYEKDLRKYEENKKKREELKSDFDDEIDRDGEDADDEEQKADAEIDDIDTDDNDQDAEVVDGKKKIVNPAKIWHKKKKKNGGTTKSYYNSKDPKSPGISQKEYQEKLVKYKEHLAKSKEKTNEEPKQEHLSFQELLKFDMLFERYGEQVPIDIIYEYHIDEDKFGEWVKRKKSSLHQSASNLRNKLKNKFHK